MSSLSSFFPQFNWISFYTSIKESKNMLEKMIPLFRNEAVLNPTLKLTKIIANVLDMNQYKLRSEWDQNKDRYFASERRVLDAIFFQKEPDRVPVIGNGINFFPAKYAGITCEEFMFDRKKLRSSVLKVVKDFDLDMHFINYMFGVGQLVQRAEFNLLRLPGHGVDKNSGYQYNERDRLKTEEYDAFRKEGMDFLIKTISPRIAGMFKYKSPKKEAIETSLLLQFIEYGSFVVEMQHEMKLNGGYTIFGTLALPPYDIMSFAFRSLHSISRDLIKKQTRESVVDICNRMNPWLLSLWTMLPKITGCNGVWFPSERAFSLSPKQFETYYWPTLKQMILKLVKEGLIPFLTWESDVTHLVPFLLELPKNVSRRCVFNCDTSDIFKVRKILGDHMCIAGNIPLSTMCVGTPHDVEKYCEKLFAELKPGGGFLLSPALGIPDEAKPENVHAMINYAKKYGKY
jgi:hypothetical protein